MQHNENPQSEEKNGHETAGLQKTAPKNMYNGVLVNQKINHPVGKLLKMPKHEQSISPGELIKKQCWEKAAAVFEELVKQLRVYERLIDR